MFGFFFIVVLVGVTAASPFHHGCPATGSYSGWSEMRHAFIFGDSYTTVGFNDTLDQPSAVNPIGNPAYPGHTFANGPNWADFITVEYNQSLLLSYNLAYSGATVDRALVKPQSPDILTLEQQISDEFIPVYGTTTHPGVVNWRSDDSIFAIFIGINDVWKTYSLGPAASTALNIKIFVKYQSLMEKLYHAGARNFLFLNVPPVDRSPEGQASGLMAQVLEKADIADWNIDVMVLAELLKNQYQEINVFTVDTNAIFSRVLNKPESYPMTAGYKNTTDYCTAYENGTANNNTYIPSCGIPVNQYFWVNSFHPTYPMHDALAFEVSQQLETGPNVC